MDEMVVLRLISMDLHVSCSRQFGVGSFRVWGRKVFRGRNRPFIHSIHNSHLTARPGFRRLELFFALEVLCSTPAVRSLKPLAASYTTTRPAVDSRMVCGAGPQETVIARGVSATRAVRANYGRAGP